MAGNFWNFTVCKLTLKIFLERDRIRKQKYRPKHAGKTKKYRSNKERSPS